MIEQSQHPVRPWWALTVALAAFAAAGWLAATTTGVTRAADGDRAGAVATDEPPVMMAVAPGGTVDLTSLPADQQALYRGAAADPDGFEAVACYCGCEAFLDHRHLGDCFVRPDGGWERHATGCGVCLAEARDVVALRADGVPIEEIVKRIDARYGGITAPPGPTDIAEESS